MLALTMLPKVAIVVAVRVQLWHHDSRETNRRPKIEKRREKTAGSRQQAEGDLQLSTGWQLIMLNMPNDRQWIQ